MPSVFSEEPQLDDSEVADYRPVSGWAVAALLLGCASALAWLGPIAWVIPILGVVAAAVALDRIRRAPGQTIGRKAALAGLGLSVVLGVSAASYLLTRQSILSARAQQFAAGWLEHMVNGRFREAHQLLLRPEERFLPDGELEAAYAGDHAMQEDSEAFLEMPPIPKIRELGEFEPADPKVYFPPGRRNRNYVRLSYDFRSPAGQTLPIDLILFRSESAGAEQWQVSQVQLRKAE